MSSSNDPLQHPGINRGNSHTPGTRTPRRVQWPDDATNDNSIHHRETPSHMLDEHGLNPEGFRVLTEALEPHRSRTPLKRVHYYPSEEPPSSSAEVVNYDHESSDSSTEEHSSDESHSIHPSSGASSIAGFTPSPSHRVPDNYISENEDAGLPGTKDLRKFARAKAENVVRTHTKKVPARIEHGRARRSKKRPRPRRHTMATTDSERETDVESEADSRQPSTGGGILSTLLNLYQLPDTSTTGSSTIGSTASSRRSSFDDYCNYTVADSDHEPPEVLSESEKKKNRKQEKADEKHGRVYNPKSWHFDIPSIFGHVSRPPAARNAGGVFGPLIASTGNLAGAAAPHASQLQPNLKRPGYNLSRYSLETKAIPRPPPAKRRHSSGHPDVPDRQLLPSTSDTAQGLPPMSPSSHIGQESFYHHGSKSNLSNILGGYVSSIRSGRRSRHNTPTKQDARPIPGQSHQRHKRRKAEVFITRYVAQIIKREEFLMKLTRAMMMFGGPSSRLQSQIQSAARVLDIQISFMHLPDIVLMSFDDNGTGTSHIKLIRQASALDLGKLDDAFALYWRVIHDKLSVSDASVELDALMRKKPLYGWAMSIFIGGMCSAAICTVSFGGSFIDALVSFPLGAILVAIQLLSVRNVLFSYVLEVTVTTVFSFIAAALATTHKLCYPAVTSSSVVLILPGFLVLTGALELMSRQIVSGSVRLSFAVVYALFLGFGFTIGSELFELMTGHKVYGAEDYTCSLTHNPDGPWYQRTPSIWWAFLTVPLYSMCLSMRNQAPWYRKELALLVLISSAGWVTTYFTGRKFVGQSDIIAAVGAFAIGLISNLYARIFSRNAFVVMITGIMFQLPSGLGSGGLHTYASQQASGFTDSYVSGFQTALKLVSVAIGLTIGLGLSLAITHPIQSRKRKAAIFSL